MAQVALLHHGEKVVQKGMATPKRASSLDHWFKEAKKACARELGPNWRAITRGKAKVSLERIEFALDGSAAGYQLVIDRTANQLGS